MKPILILIGTLCVALAACKKSNPEAPKIAEVNPTAPVLELTNERVINANTDQTILAIKNLKDRGNVLRSGNLYLQAESDSLTADSAVWLLEAALNYEFDDLIEHEKPLCYSIERDFESFNGKIAAGSLSDIFNTFATIFVCG